MSEPTASEKVGVIGLGAMGEGMARHLAAHGYKVSGYDINPAPMTRLESQGVARCDSALDAARDAQLLFLVVFRDTEADRVLFGDTDADGVLGVLAPGATIIMNTTVAPRTARDYEQRLNSAGFLYVDAPVTGGQAGADAGTLTVIASGSDAAMASTQKAFDAVGSTTYRCGDKAGDASTVKMINQMLVGCHVAATCEALAFAVKAGADPETVFEVITHGTGNSEIFKSRSPHIFNADYAPRGVTEIFTKDLGFVTELAREHEFPLPMTNQALQQFLTTASMGFLREDGIALAKVFEQIADVDISKAHGKGPVR